MANQAPTPRDQIAALRAQLDEGEALIRHLRERTVLLNGEVRSRAGHIAQLERSVATLTGELAATKKATPARPRKTAAKRLEQREAP